jgi:putative NADPH-quinone reductase
MTQMRVLYVYCHPLPESFHGAIREGALLGLKKAGHSIDLLDLYAEGFNPVISADVRRRYHDTAHNREGVEGYVNRLLSADALVLQFPTWSFGPPAMMKGFLDRMFMPGVAFDLSDPNHVRPVLRNIKKLAGVVTYGRPWHNAVYMGDPPRKIVKRYVSSFIEKGAPVRYHALYHMNVASEEKRKGFIAKVSAAMEKF